MDRGWVDCRDKGTSICHFWVSLLGGINTAHWHNTAIHAYVHTYVHLEPMTCAPCACTRILMPARAFTAVPQANHWRSLCISNYTAHAYKHTNIHTHTHTHTYVCMYVYTYVSIYIYKFSRLLSCVDTCTRKPHGLHDQSLALINIHSLCVLCVLCVGACDSRKTYRGLEIVPWTNGALKEQLSLTHFLQFVRLFCCFCMSQFLAQFGANMNHESDQRWSAKTSSDHKVIRRTELSSQSFLKNPPYMRLARNVIPRCQPWHKGGLGKMQIAGTANKIWAQKQLYTEKASSQKLDVKHALASDSL